ncbi:MAG: hypothetical protein RIC56_15590 [Pseudomonadales bacterium]
MMMYRGIAVFVAGLTTVAALFLVVDRGGAIAWGTVVLGGALLAKVWLRPSRSDTGWCFAMAIAPALAWAVTFGYVISTFESGEVVEMAIDLGSDTHTARVWVLDIGNDPVVYYETDPVVADSLVSGEPLQFTRAGETSTRTPHAERADSIPEEEANRVLEVMSAKYGDRMTAVNVYYAMLGSPRDRVSLVVTLKED